MTSASCWVCGRKFKFEPDNVPAVTIDPQQGAPPDPADPRAMKRAVRRLVCFRCAGAVSRDRRKGGLPDLWGERWL